VSTCIRRVIVAGIVLAGLVFSSTPAQARPSLRRGYRPAYGNPLYYGYGYAPYLYFNSYPYSGSWTNAGAGNAPLSYGYSGITYGQSGFTFGAPDFEYGN